MSGRDSDELRSAKKWLAGLGEPKLDTDDAGGEAKSADEEDATTREDSDVEREEADSFDVEEYGLSVGAPSDDDASDMGAERLHEPVSGSEADDDEIPLARTIPIHYESGPGPDVDSEQPKRLADREPRGSWVKGLRRFWWVVVVAFLIFSRFGFVDDLFGDPAGEQVMDALEPDLKAIGLSDEAWGCIEAGLRGGGYVDTLNEADVSDVEEALDSPLVPPPPELISFLEGFSMYINPSQGCLTAEEASTLAGGVISAGSAEGASGPEGNWDRRNADFSEAAPSVFFEDFSSREGMTLVGSTVFVDDALSLTRKVEGSWQSGAAWYPERLSVADGFEAAFAFQIDHVSWFTIGHGFAFVIQNASADELGDGEGSGGPGYRTIRSSVAIEFDTVYQDYLGDPRTLLPPTAEDPPSLLANHIAVHTNGSGVNTTHSRHSVAFSGLPILLADRQVHVALVRYQDGQLAVFIDDFPNPVLSTTIDLSTLGLTNSAAFVGFTAGTDPGFYSDHRILGWAFNSPCLTDDCAP